MLQDSYKVVALKCTGILYKSKEEYFWHTFYTLSLALERNQQELRMFNALMRSVAHLYV
jgi:hypothetical protein